MSEDKPQQTFPELATEKEAASPTPTGLDISALRLPQNFGSMIGVKKVLTTVPVRKPTRQEFVRVHHAESWQLQTAVLEVKEDREHFLIAPPFGQRYQVRSPQNCCSRQSTGRVFPSSGRSACLERTAATTAGMPAPLKPRSWP